MYYRKDLEIWEQKMVAMGRTDLVRAKPVREKQPKKTETKQQGFGCSDDTDSNQLDIKNNIASVQSINKHSFDSSGKQESKESHHVQNGIEEKKKHKEDNKNTEVPISVTDIASEDLPMQSKQLNVNDYKSDDRQSTSEQDSQKSETSVSHGSSTKKSNIFTSIKSFFRRQMNIQPFILLNVDDLYNKI